MAFESEETMNKKWFDILMMGIPLVFRLIFRLIDKKRKKREGVKDESKNKTE